MSPMQDPKQPAGAKAAVVGDVFHFLITGFPFAGSTSSGAGMVSRRGQELRVTDDLIAAERDRHGACWIDLLHDPEGQVARFGRMIFSPGSCPEDMVRSEPGSVERQEERRRALEAANAIPDWTERDREIKRIKLRFGPPGRGGNSVQYR